MLINEQTKMAEEQREVLIAQNAKLQTIDLPNGSGNTSKVSNLTGFRLVLNERLLGILNLYSQ